MISALGVDSKLRVRCVKLDVLSYSSPPSYSFLFAKPHVLDWIDSWFPQSVCSRRIPDERHEPPCFVQISAVHFSYCGHNSDATESLQSLVTLRIINVSKGSWMRACYNLSPRYQHSPVFIKYISLNNAISGLINSFIARTCLDSQPQMLR